ncbi:pre-mRNA-splicing factor CWC25 isoform X1 [Telopea speciosissima]|uniref:pre-mRNA-splicing factor CWC25 isoform X1 n=1 Tax=Telopea speciosissima TaxID=54955 RepID=UPI001CC6A1A1|nr:pre-mRNA-splicing factor CWC25 isoform X1 [Telopea speciosissima]XP_043689394.1 pre-mRNA-splicing factor CWC25 isoform X1 [Telopea speciosissima]
MASVKSSSRKKSSLSHKKKRSKPSSETGRRKRSRSRKIDKSKKLRRRDASISYSEDDSKTEDSIFVSSSDSEDDYRSRRARSRTREDAKGSRKRARRSSLSRDADKDLPNRRKRKGSKRKRASVERKNSNRRNRESLRSRGDANVSSASNGSSSCSTCRGSSHERSRGRSEERDRYKRSPSKTSNGRFKNRYRFSRSCSSCSTCSDHRRSYKSEEKYMGENPRFLKSVLTDTKHSKEKEGNQNGKDDDRTEIVQAYDDCPSSRSNDSYDGGRKREISYHQHGASDKKRRVANAKGEDTLKIKTTEIVGIGKENDGGKYAGNCQNLSIVGSTKTSTGSRSEVPSATGSSEGNDLELYLRQKALENLRKFRGGPQTNTKTLQKEESGGDEKLPSNAKIETVRNEPRIEDRSQLLGATQVSQNVTPFMERKPTFFPPKDGLMPDKRHESKVKLDNVHSVKGVGNVALKQTAVTGNLTEKNKLNVGINVTRRQESSGAQSNLKEAPTSKESPKEKLLETRNVSNRSVTTDLKASPRSSNTHGAAIDDSRPAATEASTIPNTATAVHCQNQQQDEAKGSSQFEQKTMSVMRGGELVQVSYKVYIPKKAPALARRQLQR